MNCSLVASTLLAIAGANVCWALNESKMLTISQLIIPILEFYDRIVKANELTGIPSQQELYENDFLEKIERGEEEFKTYTIDIMLNQNLQNLMQKDTLKFSVENDKEWKETSSLEVWYDEAWNRDVKDLYTRNGAKKNLEDNCTLTYKQEKERKLQMEEDQEEEDDDEEVLEEHHEKKMQVDS